MFYNLSVEFIFTFFIPVISFGFEKASEDIQKYQILYFYCQVLGIRDYSLQPESCQIFKYLKEFTHLKISILQ